MIDTSTNDLKGFAYADITTDSAALDDDAILNKAIKSLHGLQWKGSKLRVERAAENGLDKLARERKVEAEYLATSALAEHSLPVVTSLPQKLRIRKRGYEPCIEVFSTPFESTESAEAVEAKRILNLPPLKMAKELEKKVRHRAVRIQFTEEGNQLLIPKQETEKLSINVDESKKRLWEERVGRTKISAEPNTTVEVVTSKNIETNTNFQQGDGIDSIRSSMLSDARRQLSILSSLLGDTDLAEPEYFTGKEVKSKEEKNESLFGESQMKTFDQTFNKKRNTPLDIELTKSSSLSTLSNPAPAVAVSSTAVGPLPNTTIVQVNVPSWRSLIYGEKLAQAGRTQISLADAKATLVVNPSKDLSLQVEEGEEEGKGGPIGKFLSVYKSSVPLHVDPSFTFSFGSGEDSSSNGERARSVKVVDAAATNSGVDVIMEKDVSSSKHDITSMLASNEEKVNKPVEPPMDPAERWLSHRPETKRKKEEQQMKDTKTTSLFSGTTTFSNHQQAGQRQGQSSLGSSKQSGMMMKQPITTTGPSLPQSSFSSLLSKAGSFFGTSNSNISAAKELLKKDFRSKQRQSQ